MHASILLTVIREMHLAASMLASMLVRHALSTGFLLCSAFARMRRPCCPFRCSTSMVYHIVAVSQHVAQTCHQHDLPLLVIGPRRLEPVQQVMERRRKLRRCCAGGL